MSKSKKLKWKNECGCYSISNFLIILVSSDEETKEWPASIYSKTEDNCRRIHFCEFYKTLKEAKRCVLQEAVNFLNNEALKIKELIK